jgi:hypothetical protein
MNTPLIALPESITTGQPDQGPLDQCAEFVAGAPPMKCAAPEALSIVHNKVPSRIRFRVPVIKHKRTLAELLKHSLLNDPLARGIYHAEPNVATGTLLVKYHPALHTEADVVRLVQMTVQRLAEGKIEITAKHKNPRIGKMRPGAFFTRELLVSIFGNVIAGVILAALVAG